MFSVMLQSSSTFRTDRPLGFRVCSALYLDLLVRGFTGRSGLIVACLHFYIYLKYFLDKKIITRCLYELEGVGIPTRRNLLRGNGDCNDVLGVGDVEVGVALFGELDRLGSSSAGPTSIAIGP